MVNFVFRKDLPGSHSAPDVFVSTLSALLINVAALKVKNAVATRLTKTNSVHSLILAVRDVFPKDAMSRE